VIHSHNKESSDHIEGNKLPDWRFVTCGLATVYLLMAIGMPLLLFYTPLKRGIAEGEETLVIVVLEALMAFAFLIGYLNLRTKMFSRAVPLKKRSIIPFLAIPILGSMLLYYFASYDSRFLFLGVAFVFFWLQASQGTV